MGILEIASGRETPEERRRRYAELNQRLLASSNAALAQANARLADEMAAATHVEASTDNEGETLRRVLATMDPTQAQIMTIADKLDINANQKLRAISALDSRFYGKESPELGSLLKITASAIRQTDWWNIDRKEYLERES